jgi:hypothetical protein
MGTQIGVVAPQQLAINSMIIGYNKQLQMKALLDDIYVKLMGVYNTERKTIPNAVMNMITGDLGESTVGTITMKLKLSGAGNYGENFLIGTEELPQTRACRVFRNNLRKAVSTPGYGVIKLDAKLYRLYEQHVDDLADWNKEHHGLEIRQAVLETFGETLMYGVTAPVCVRNWNMNIFVAGLDARYASPTYSNAVATYTTNILAKVKESGGGSIKIPHVGQTLGQPVLSNASNWALSRIKSQLSIPGLPGGKGYILTMSEIQGTYLGDPAWSARNLGALYIAKAALPEKVMNWPGVIGAYKNFLLVVDERQPTIDITGTSAPHGLTAGYVWPGETDLRGRDQDTVLDTAFILGKNAIMSWEPEPLHHIQQVDDYGKMIGHGTALVRGIQVPTYT